VSGLWSVAAVVGSGLVVALLLPGAGRSPDQLPVATPLGSDGTVPSRGASRDDPPVLRWVATVGVGLGVLFFVGGTRGLVAALVAGVGCWWLTGRMEPPSVRRRRERLAASVPHAVDLMAACLAAGLSPAAAVEQIAEAVDEPLSDELAGLGSRLRLGVDPETVWRDLARHPQLGGLGRTVSRAVESGASVADAMARLAEDLRRLNRSAVESRARAVGVKAALPLGVCLLPAFVLVGVVPLVAGSLSVVVR
jgi:Flp pilus assembly protein TadB